MPSPVIVVYNPRCTVTELLGLYAMSISDISSMPCLPSPVIVVYNPRCTVTHITGTVRNVYFRYFKHAMFAKPSHSCLQPTVHSYTHYLDCMQCLFQIFQACHVCQAQPKLFTTHSAQIHTLLGLYAMSISDISSVPCLPNSIKVIFNPRCTNPHITGPVRNVYELYGGG